MLTQSMEIKLLLLREILLTRVVMLTQSMVNSAEIHRKYILL